MPIIVILPFVHAGGEEGEQGEQGEGERVRGERVCVCESERVRVRG